MVDTDLLVLVAAAELALLLGIALILVFRTALVAFRVPRRNRTIREAETELITTLESGSPELGTFSGLRETEQVEALFDLLPNLSGESRTRLAVSAGGGGVSELGAKWCRSRRWGMRVRGAEVLSVLGQDGPVDDLLEDRRPEVRIRAVIWAATRNDDQLLDRLCLMLGDPDPGVRFTVMDSLLRVGGAAVEPIRRTIEADPDPETTAAALRVASGIGDHRLAELALRACDDPRTEVRSTAAAAAGSLGGPHAGARLELLLVDPEADVREQAVDALRRMNSWAASPEIARLLADPDWPVRRAAAIALDEFGPIGRLYIRRTARGEDSLASRVAAQALGPAASGVAR